MSILTKTTAWLATLPSTNLRITATLCLCGGTAVVYWSLAIAGRSWEPSWEWLAFLTAMAGVDVAQFATKRKTDAGYVGATTPQGSPRPSVAIKEPA